MAHWHPVTSPIQTATATLHTNRGDIKIALFGNHAPKTVANFVGLAQGTKDYSAENASGSTSGPFYDGVVFHRDHRRLHDPGRRPDRGVEGLASSHRWDGASKHRATRRRRSLRAVTKGQPATA